MKKRTSTVRSQKINYDEDSQKEVNVLMPHDTTKLLLRITDPPGMRETRIFMCYDVIIIFEVLAYEKIIDQ